MTEHEVQFPFAAVSPVSVQQLITPCEVVLHNVVFSGAPKRLVVGSDHALLCGELSWWAALGPVRALACPISRDD